MCLLRTSGNSPLCPTGHRPFGAAALLSLHFFSWSLQAWLHFFSWSLQAGHRVPLTMCDPWMTSCVCLCVWDGGWGVDGGWMPLPIRPQRYCAICHMCNNIEFSKAHVKNSDSHMKIGPVRNLDLIVAWLTPLKTSGGERFSFFLTSLDGPYTRIFLFAQE